MNYVEVLREIFSDSRYRLAFAILMVALTPLFAVTSDIIVPSTLGLNPIVEPQKIALMFIIIILIALNATVLLHNYETRKKSGKHTTILGTIAALFTTACPVCQPIWLVWLGLGSATAFLADISVYVGGVSILLLVVSLHYSLKSVSTICEVE